MRYTLQYTTKIIIKRKNENEILKHGRTNERNEMKEKETNFLKKLR